MTNTVPRSGLHPLLRWAGSKRQLIPYLRGLIGDSQVKHYVEPFAGSACLFFALKPKAAVLGDANDELIATYRTIRQHPTRVASHLSRLAPSREYYNELRRLDPTHLQPIARAARFIYLNRFCFNGLYRTNRRGEFNVPYAPRKTGVLPTRDALIDFAKALDRVKLVDDDFELVVRENAKAGTLVYMDPPFVVNQRRVFRQYTGAVFDSEALSRLRKLMFDLDALGARFIVSYADSAEGRALGRGWSVSRRQVHRNISGFAVHRQRARELVITNLLAG